MYARRDPETKPANGPRVSKIDTRSGTLSGTTPHGSPHDPSLLELQRLAGNATVSRFVAGDADDAPNRETARSSVLDVVSRRDGEPLSAELRDEMESRLGADFGSVRIHRDQPATESAETVNARAYTVGSNVVFRSDRWDPGSTEGKRTLAHELTHVVQQAAGPVAGEPAPGGIRVSDPDDEFERAAERSADRALAAPSPTPAAASGGSPSAQLEAAAGTKVPGEEEELEEEEELQGSFVQRETEEDELEDELPEEAKTT